MKYPQSDLIQIADRIDTHWLQQRRGFITGASGWFGSWICQVLEYIGAKSIKLWHTDKVNIETFRIPEQDIDYIIHLSPGRVTRVIECAQYHDVEAVLFTSSGAVYAEDIDEYGQMKRDNEWELINGDVRVKIARCFTFAGAGVPLHKGFALGNFIGQALDEKDLHIWNDGSAIRTYMHMIDLVVWLFKIMIDGECGRFYDVGTEEEITIWELAMMIQKQFDSGPEIIFEGKTMTERFPYYVPDITDALDLGCRIEIQQEEAIRKTVEFYKGAYTE